MDESFSPADLAAVTNTGRDGMFGGTGIWVFALLILLLIGNGNLFGNGRSGQQYATTQDVQDATNFAALERQNNEGVAATRQATYDVTGAVKDATYNQLGEIRDLQAAVATNGANLSNCCCSILRATDSVNYNGAINTAAINANTTEQTQKILDAICSNRVADMQNQINQLQLQAALCGVPRINTFAYGIVPNYGCGCNTGCGCGC